MWQVIQHRWIRDSQQEHTGIVWEGSKKKSAQGQVKSHLDSHISMLIKHDYPYFYEEVVFIDEKLYKQLIFIDLDGPFYSISYEAIENA